MTKTLAILRLLRAGALFSPAADILAGLCLAGGALGVDFARAALASVFLYGAGMVLNDVFDIEEDRRRRPERPLPQGILQLRTAALLGFTLLLLGVLTAPTETRWIHGILAVLVLGYDTVLKRTTVTAMLTMGLLRGLNLAAGAILVVDGPSNWQDLEPVVYIAATCYALIIATITLLGRLEDQRGVNARTVASLLALPPTLGLVAVVSTENGGLAAGVALIPVILFGRFCRGMGRDWPPEAIRRGVGWLLLGCMLYDALLCLGAGRIAEAVAVLAAAAIARRVTRIISWT